MTKILTKKSLALISFLVVAVLALGFSPVAKADEITDLQAQIEALLSQINQLEGDDDDNSSDAMESGYKYHPNVDYYFSNNLYPGANNAEVKMLQKALNDGGYSVSQSGLGSEGNESTYFGGKTTAAVASFQSAVGINAGAYAGYFGPSTRNMFNTQVEMAVEDEDEDEDDHMDDDHMSNDFSDPVSDSDDGDGDVEVNDTKTADDGEFYNGVVRYVALSFEVEADGDATVDSIVLEYDSRVDADDIIDTVVLATEDGRILSDDEDVNSDDEVEFNRIDLDIEDGDTVEVLVYINAVDDIDPFGEEDGRDFMFSLVGVELNDDGDVDGLPIDGPEHTIQDGDSGEVTTDVDNEGRSIEIGEDTLITTIKITADPDDSDDVVFVRSLRVENIGSGDLSDLEDVYMEVGSDEYEAYADLISDDHLVFIFEDGIEIEDGDSEDFEIKATVDDGIDEDYYFHIEETYDLHAEHEDGYGMPVVLQTCSTGTTTCGSLSTTEGASLTLTSSGDDEQEEVSVGDDILLGMFEIDIDGEDIEVDEWSIYTNVSNATLASGSDNDDFLLENVYIEDEDGNKVAGTEDADWVTEVTVSSGNFQTVFDNVELEEGDMTYYIYATINDNVGNGTTYGFILATDAPYAYMSDLEGARTGENVDDISTTAITLDTRSVEAGDLEVSLSGSPSSRTLGDDVDDVVFARFEFDTGASGEIIELDGFEALVNTTALGLDRMTNCRIYDEDDDEVELDRSLDGDDASTVSAGSQYRLSIDFENNYVIDNNDVVELELRCDIGSVTNGVTYQIELDGSEDVDAEGEETGNDVTAVVSVSTGGTITIGEAALEVSEDSSSPATELVVEGAEVVLGVLELEANDGEIVVEDIELTLTGDSETLDGGKVYIYFEGEEVAIATFNTDEDGVTAGIQETVEDIDITIEDDDSIELEFRATISSVGEDEDANNGESVALSIENVTAEDSDVTINGAATLGTAIDFDTMYVFETVPSIAEVSFEDDDEDIENGENELLVFSVSADDADDVTLGGILLTFTPSGLQVDSARVEVSSNSSFSNLVSTSDGKFDSAISNIVAETSDLIVFADDNTDNFLEIPDGETYYFRVIGDLSAVVDGDSIRVSIEEDETDIDSATSSSATKADNTTAIGTVEDGNSNPANFVWTADFNTSEVTTWFNGFEIEGSSSNIDNTRDIQN